MKIRGKKSIDLCTMENRKSEFRTDLVITEDGSHTLFNPDFGESYHSRFGAIAESVFVYLNNGIAQISKDTISVFEMGFGTGLNAFLTFLWAAQHNKVVSYTVIEKYPIPCEMAKQLNYHLLLAPQHHDAFLMMHSSGWNDEISFDKLKLRKVLGDFSDYTLPGSYDIFFYDAFSAERQPELWTTEIFRKIFVSLNPGGILVTYSAKGDVRRNLKESGFRVEKLQGPPGKKHMLRAFK